LVEYVSYRAFEPLIRIARHRGLDEETLSAVVGCSHDVLLVERGYVSWEAFAEYCATLEAMLGGPEQVAEIGRILQDVPSYASLLRLGGLVTSPGWFFDVLMRWFGPSMIPAVRYEGYRTEEKGVIEITLVGPANEVDCPSFFRIVASFFRFGPTLVGIPPALVSMEPGERQATYRIELPPSVSIAARVKRALHSAWSGHAVVDELVAQHDALLKNYEALKRSEKLRQDMLSRAVEMDRMISMGILAAGVGHEIRNPLSYLKANVDYSQAVVEEVAEGLKDGGLTAKRLDSLREELEEVARALQTSNEGIDRIAAIAHDLNTFSHPGAPVNEAVYLDEVIQTSLNIARHEIRPRARIVTALECKKPVRANENKLGQVLLNLLINAAQSIEPGDSETQEIRIQTLVSGEEAVIEIEDTGKGIDREDLEKIFEPFFTTKPPGEGTGLGLSISRNIVESFGGSLTLESRVGVGTAARVRLPLMASGQGSDG
jgi:signal transduction histidine kinase